MTAMPKSPALLALCVLAMGSLVLPGCASSNARELAEARDLIQRYEQKYGKLDAAEGRRDFRELQRSLRGRSMHEVSQMLGKPNQVEGFGQVESWSYLNAAYDPATERVVRQMTVWFLKGVVDETRASF